MNTFQKNFINPPKEFSAIPFWFLNDDLNPDHLRYQLQEMYDKGIFECILHARKGMEIEYLSEEWFSSIGVILKAAERLEMKVWIYDEDNWPSGYAGGGVIKRNPKFAATCLSVEKIIPVTGKPIKIPEVHGKELVSVIAVWHNEKFYDITDYENKKSKDWISPGIQWEIFVLRSEKCSHSPAYSDEPYVDLLNPDAVLTFIELTHSEYKRRFPEHWGSTIKGFFTDEPGFYQNYVYQTKNINTIPWTKNFPLFFKEQCGYDLMPYIGALWDDMGDISRKIRHDYYKTLTELYNLSFFKQLYDFCEKDGLSSIGHLHMEEHLSDTVQMEGHFFEDMRFFHVPGVDRIDRNRNRITEKLASSAMHMYGRRRCFSETYGCFGWGLTLQEMKAEADWQYVQGVNMMIPHAFFSSIEGIRKNESPPSLFYQNPYWKYFETYSNYIRRLSFALSEGSYCSDILVYYPIVSCWEQFRPLAHYSVDKLDEEFIRISLLLLQNQLDFDFVDDSSFCERFQIKDNQILNGETVYKSVILPPVTSMPIETFRVLAEFAQGGGIIIVTSKSQVKAALPEDDNEASKLWIKISKSKRFIYSNISELHETCRKLGLNDFVLETPDTNIKYMHRKTDSYDLYFIINESDSDVFHTCSVPICNKAVIFNLETGCSTPIDTLIRSDRSIFQLRISAQGSVLIGFENNENIYELTNWVVTLPDGTQKETKLNDWSEFGFSDYSGSIIYKTELELGKASNVSLDLGKVCDIAEVFVNNVNVAYRCWAPFVFNISNQVHIGKNIIEVKITNTLANRLTELKAPSGLFGKKGKVIVKYE